MKAAGKKLAIVFVDISIAALLLLGIYIINYTIRKRVSKRRLPLFSLMIRRTIPVMSR